MSLINSYVQVLNENRKSSEVSGAVPKAGSNAAGPLKVAKQKDPEGFDSKEPTKGPSMECDSEDAKPSKLTLDKSSYSNNPFDSLVTRILEQEDWEDLDSAEDTPSEGGADFSFEVGAEDEQSEEEGEEEESEGGQASMSAVLNNLKSAIEALTDLLKEEEGDMGEGEGEGEDEDGLGDMGDGMDDLGGGAEEAPKLSGEAVDAEVVGHALVQINKLLSGLTGSNNKVAGAVPTSTGKASVTKGSSNDGELSELSDDPEKLTKKDNKVGSVNKVGKSIFEQ